MTINQEVDALQVMGINPVRYLVTPVVLALAIMLPCLAMWANLVSSSCRRLLRLGLTHPRSAPSSTTR